LITDETLTYLSSYRLAGDAFLWSRLAIHSPLIVVQTIFAGFRISEGQLSDNKQSYSAELQSLHPSVPVLTATLCFLENVLWYLPDPLKWRLFSHSHIRCEPKGSQWNLASGR
jgi:hypothetical protein